MPTPIPSPSAICTVNGTDISQVNTSGLDVASASTITIALDSVSGVDSWSIIASSADDITYANGNLVAVNNSKVVSGFSATFVMPALISGRGAGIQFRSIVNQGESNENQVTLGVWVLNSNGTRLFFGGETIESNATVGNAADLNRLASQGSPTGLAYGDLTGTYPNPTVVGLQGRPLNGAAPSNGWTLVWSTTDGYWKPAPASAASTIAGDVTGSLGASTVVKLQNIDVQAGTPTDGYVLTYISGDNSWEAKPTATQFVAGGDLSGTSTNQTVIKINGTSVPATPTTGQVLTATSGTTATWQTPASGFTAGGDLSGTPTSQNVIALHSATTSINVGSATAPTSGQVLTATNSTTATWVTPSGSPTGSAGGDLSGTYPNPIVAKINGTTVPSGGSLTTGNGLYVTGSSTVSYSALNLAGGSNYVTGVLPAGNQAAQSLSGDATGTTAAVVNTTARGLTSATTVVSVSAATAPTSGQVLTATSSTTATWQSNGSFTAGGDLTGNSSVQIVGQRKAFLLGGM